MQAHRSYYMEFQHHPPWTSVWTTFGAGVSDKLGVQQGHCREACLFCICLWGSMQSCTVSEVAEKIPPKMKPPRSFCIWIIGQVPPWKFFSCAPFLKTNSRKVSLLFWIGGIIASCFFSLVSLLLPKPSFDAGNQWRQCIGLTFRRRAFRQTNLYWNYSFMNPINRSREEK